MKKAIIFINLLLSLSWLISTSGDTSNENKPFYVANGYPGCFFIHYQNDSLDKDSNRSFITCLTYSTGYFRVEGEENSLGLSIIYRIDVAKIESKKGNSGFDDIKEISNIFEKNEKGLSISEIESEIKEKNLTISFNKEQRFSDWKQKWLTIENKNDIVEDSTIVESLPYEDSNLFLYEGSNLFFKLKVGDIFDEANTGERVFNLFSVIYLNRPNEETLVILPMIEELNYRSVDIFEEFRNLNLIEQKKEIFGFEVKNFENYSEEKKNLDEKVLSDKDLNDSETFEGFGNNLENLKKGETFNENDSTSEFEEEKGLQFDPIEDVLNERSVINTDNEEINHLNPTLNSPFKRNEEIFDGNKISSEINDLKELSSHLEGMIPKVGIKIDDNSENQSFGTLFTEGTTEESDNLKNLSLGKKKKEIPSKLTSKTKEERRDIKPSQEKEENFNSSLKLLPSPSLENYNMNYELEGTIIDEIFSGNGKDNDISSTPEIENKELIDEQTIETTKEKKFKTDEKISANDKGFKNEEEGNRENDEEVSKINISKPKRNSSISASDSESDLGFDGNLDQDDLDINIDDIKLKEETKEKKEKEEIEEEEDTKKKKEEKDKTSKTKEDEEKNSKKEKESSGLGTLSLKIFGGLIFIILVVGLIFFLLKNSNKKD